VGDSIRFSDSSSIALGSITSWRWNFDDGQSTIYSNNNPFYHPYATVGNYLVKLVTVSDKGCTSDTAKVQVSVNSKPVATITLNGKPCIDSIFNFISSVGIGSGNPPVWYWSFGDGQTLSTTTTNTASHSYSSTGSNIIIKHVVSYGAGCTSDTATANIPLISINPTASFSIIGDTLCERKIVLFDAIANPTINEWHWKIGSLDTIALPPLKYIFNIAGSYATSLIVKANSGCTSAPFSKTLIINPTPSIDAGPDKIITTGSSTTLDAFISNPSSYNYLWSPALNLSSATVLNPIAIPTITTVYNIVAMDKINFCFNTDSVKINVVTKVSVPNAFSPNGDGINDKWVIEGLELYPDATVTVFTRGGQQIFETRNYKTNQWDGTNNGKPAPIGSYAYIIKLFKDKSDVIAGMLTILR
jgi:gliding motility-associated-like protein